MGRLEVLQVLNACMEQQSGQIGEVVCGDRQSEALMAQRLERVPSGNTRLAGRR